MSSHRANDENKTRKALAKGAGVNLIGIAAKSLQPLLFILMTRLYGPTVFGVYILAYTLMEMAVSLLISGFQDGVLLFASRHVHEKSEHDIMYRSMANALIVVFILTAVLWTFVFTAGTPVLDMFFDRAGLPEAINVMVLALPFIALPQLVAAATKSLMIMKYDVFLISFLRPALILVIATVVYLLSSTPTVTGLAVAYLAGNFLVAVVSLPIFGRHFSFSELFKSIRKPRFHKELMGFAIPQNLNLTLVRFLNGISILFLGASGISSAKIAFFGTASELFHNLRQIRLVFSTAFSPVIARLFKERKIEELEFHYADLTRWIVSITVPLSLVMVAFRSHLIMLFHESYFHYESAFMILFAFKAFLGCAFGLAGNTIVMTGHSKWNLFISMGAAAISVVLNMVLIPIWGLTGAALAATLTTVAYVGTSLVLTNYFLNIRLKIDRVYKPFLAGLGGSVAYAAIAFIPADSRALHATGLALGGIAVFIILTFALGLHERDKEMFSGFKRRLARRRND